MDIQEFAERVGDGTETSGTRQNICRKFMEIVYLYIIDIAIKHSVLSGFCLFRMKIIGNHLGLHYLDFAYGGRCGEHRYLFL